MKNGEQIKSIAVLVAGSCALVFVIYNLLQSFREDGLYSIEIRKRKKQLNSKGDLPNLLEALEEDEIEKTNLLFVLSKLTDLAAFTDIQDKINELGYLPQIMRVLNTPDDDVKRQAALLVNNLALNNENQPVLKDCIPTLVNILKSNQVTQSTITLFTAVLQALTNLTTLNQSHQSIVPYVNVLCELLDQCDVVQIKLQVLKILVNISTNDQLCETHLELDAQMLSSVGTYVSQDIEEKYLLRAVTCCANIMTSLHRRWKHGKQASIATPEFVSQKLYENLITLTSHSNEDIRFQTNRALIALRQPLSSGDRKCMADSDSVDILDVLKI